jgi:hypothetical protein
LEKSGESTNVEEQLQRQLEERLAAEREKRIAEAQQKALSRIGKRDLTRGWMAWVETYEATHYMKRVLAASTSKLRRPKLVACFREWHDDYAKAEYKAQGRKFGSELSREAREARSAKAELEKVRAELEKLRQATLDGRGLEEEEHARILEEELNKERTERIEHIKRISMRRLGNRQLALGWGKWVAAWEEGLHMQQLLRASAAKLIKPKLVGCVAYWRRDYEYESYTARSKGLAEQLRTQSEKTRRAEAELAYLRNELSAARSAVGSYQDTTGEMREWSEEQLEKAKMKRIQHTQEMAVRRLGRRELARGWMEWCEMVAVRIRKRRLLKAAGQRLFKPKVSRSFAVWARVAHLERKALDAKEAQRKMAASSKDKVALEHQLESTMREYAGRKGSYRARTLQCIRASVPSSHRRAHTVHTLQCIRAHCICALFSPWRVPCTLACTHAHLSPRCPHDGMCGRYEDRTRLDGVALNESCAAVVALQAEVTALRAQCDDDKSATGALTQPMLALHCTTCTRSHCTACALCGIRIQVGADGGAGTGGAGE